MYRRTLRRLTEEAFKKLQQEAEDELRTGKRNFRVMRGNVYDPVATQVEYDNLQMKSKLPANMKGSSSPFVTDANFSLGSEDYKRWMELEKASTILQLNKQKLNALKEEEVDQAWRPLYKHASTQREQQEILAAAQVLLEYIGSPLYDAKKKHYFADTVNKARIDIDETSRRDRQKLQGKLMRGFGAAQLFVTFFFIFGCIIMLLKARRDEVQDLYMKARRKLAIFLSMPSNLEPPPNYFTRYRDTPTTLDEHLASPMPDIDDPVVLQIAEDLKKDHMREDALLAELSHASDAAALMPERPNAPAAVTTPKNVNEVGVMELVTLFNRAAPSKLQREITNM